MSPCLLRTSHSDKMRMSHGCPTDVPRMSHGTLPDCYPSGIPCWIPSRILLRDSINTLKAASHLGLCEFMGFPTRFFTRFGENLWLAATAICEGGSPLVQERHKQTLIF